MWQVANGLDNAAVKELASYQVEEAPVTCQMPMQANCRGWVTSHTEMLNPSWMIFLLAENKFNTNVESINFNGICRSSCFCDK